MRQQKFRKNSERGDAMVSLLIFGVAIVGLVGIVVSNPTVLTKMIGDQEIVDQEALRSVAARGYSMIQINPDGTQSIQPGTAVGVFMETKNFLANANYSRTATSCGAVIQAYFQTVGNPGSITWTYLAKESFGLCGLGAWTTHTDCRDKAMEALLEIDPSALNGESYTLGCLSETPAKVSVRVPVLSNQLL